MAVPLPIHGRGAAFDPPNRFVPVEFEPDGDAMDADLEEGRAGPATQFLVDDSRTIISHNDSPDVGFEYSLNPYRGCEHGCIYCYARPTHEYFGLSAGLDFETKIFVKTQAPALLRAEMCKPRWTPRTISISGVTDPYQPIERRLKLTRRCLEVLAEFRNPVGIVTKNATVARDVDVLAELARHQAAAVFVSITTLDAALSAKMEPRASSPRRRLEAIEALARAGVPVGVMAAPIIPGLTDLELPAILRAAAQAGAQAAGCVPVRLPGAVAPLFEKWLADHFPDRAAKVLNRIRTMRGGKLNDPNFGTRMRGEGPFADGIRALFDLWVRKLGLDQRPIKLSATSFRRPLAAGGQMGLFDLAAK